MLKIFLATALLLACAPGAFAQGNTGSSPGGSGTGAGSGKVINQYDDQYKVKPVIVQSTNRDIIPQNKFGVYFVRKDEADAATATLRLASPLSIDGCAEIAQPPPVVTEEPPYLRVDIENASLRLSPEARKTQTGCSAPPKFLFADIALNRDELMLKNINKIMLRRHLYSDTYRIDIDDQHMVLTPETQGTFKPQDVPGKSNPLEYWFYPKNTIILSVPKSKDARETYALLKPLASDAGLITLGSVLPDFSQTLDGETRFYFVDETGALPARMGDKNSMPFGTIDVQKSLTGMSGRYNVTETLNIFAMKPGAYD